MQEQTTPYGYCECGCGERTTVAAKTDRKYGWVKGEPKRFLRGHANTKPQADWYRVEDRGHATPCWIWQMSTIHNGYGMKSHEARMTMAHRFMYERLVGPVPDGLELDHLCRVRECCNPDHLELVTPAENQRRGIRTKLDWSKVLQIRASSETDRALAVRFGVCQATISHVRTRRIWKAP